MAQSQLDKTKSDQKAFEESHKEFETLLETVESQSTVFEQSQSTVFDQSQTTTYEQSQDVTRINLLSSDEEETPKPNTPKKPVPKKRKLDDMEVECCDSGSDRIKKIRLAADKIRQIGMEVFKTHESVKRLSDLPDGTVLEVLSGEEVDGLDETKALLIQTCHKDDKGKHVKETIMIPMRMKPRADPPFPCLLVYHGTAESRKGMVYKVDLAMTGTKERIRQEADKLRLLSPQELENKFRIRSLANFEPGTVFISHAVRPLECNIEQADGSSKKIKTYAMDFETKDKEGETITGQVFIPSRAYNDVKNNTPGLMVYTGDQTAKKSGRDYRNLKVVRDVNKYLEL